MIELDYIPALICCECKDFLTKAIKFRRKARESDNFFKTSRIKQIENSRWNSELSLIENSKVIKNEVVITEYIKTEPIPITSDFEEMKIEQIENYNDERFQKKSKDRKKCSYCNDTFVSKKTLRYHIQLKHEFQPNQGFKCDVS